MTPTSHQQVSQHLGGSADSSLRGGGGYQRPDPVLDSSSSGPPWEPKRDGQMDSPARSKTDSLFQT